MAEQPMTPSEVEDLGRAMQRLVYGDTETRKLFQKRFNVTVTRADYYSELPTIEEIEASTKKTSLLKLDAIFADREILLSTLRDLHAYSSEFDPPVRSDIPGEYSWEGGPFGYSDAMAYYAMIRLKKPRTILEIGSGWSTLVALQAIKANGMGRVVCIEPYPADFLKERRDIELIQKRVQDVETDLIRDTLQDGDIFFIDSTHTVKHDGDCLHIYLRILPNLDVNVTVHVHDIYLPDARHAHHLLKHQTYWNEQYLLYAYLISNPNTRVIYGSWHHHQNNKNLLDQFMHGKYKAGGNSFWFSQENRGRRRSQPFYGPRMCGVRTGS